MPGRFMEIKSLTKDDIKNQALVHCLSFRKAYKGIIPDYWGKGYGSKLFDFSISELRKRGYKEITLWVFEKNQRARTFYEKKGFSFDGTKKEINPEEKLIEIRYSLTINS